MNKRDLLLLINKTGALSDVNSLLNDGVGAGGDFDMADDTSLSSRASSRFFDSEPILNLDAFAHSSAGGKSRLLTTKWVHYKL